MNNLPRSAGATRKIDELGRVVLPIDVRRRLNIDENDTLEIHLAGDGILIRKYQPTCVFCNSAKHKIIHMGKCVCMDCVGRVSRALK